MNKLLTFLALLPGLTHAVGITVNGGGMLNLGDGSITLNCTELNIAASGQVSLDQGALNNATNIINNGQLNGGQGNIDLTGNWAQSGTFTANTSTVNIIDGCNTTTTVISGSSNFSSLSATTAGARSLNFEAGTTQQVSTALTLTGTTGNLLIIRSTAASQLAALNLAPGASQTINFIDVADNQASGQPIAPGAAATYNSVNSGNAPGWFTVLTEEIFDNGFE